MVGHESLIHHTVHKYIISYDDIRHIRLYIMRYVSWVAYMLYSRSWVVYIIPCVSISFRMMIYVISVCTLCGMCLELLIFDTAGHESYTLYRASVYHSVWRYMSWFVYTLCSMSWLFIHYTTCGMSRWYIIYHIIYYRVRSYGVATTSRLLKFIGVFCKSAL